MDKIEIIIDNDDRLRKIVEEIANKLLIVIFMRLMFRRSKVTFKNKKKSNKIVSLKEKFVKQDHDQSISVLKIVLISIFTSPFPSV